MPVEGGGLGLGLLTDSACLIHQIILELIELGLLLDFILLDGHLCLFLFLQDYVEIFVHSLSYVVGGKGDMCLHGLVGVIIVGYGLVVRVIDGGMIFSVRVAGLYISGREGDMTIHVSFLFIALYSLLTTK